MKRLFSLLLVVLYASGCSTLQVCLDTPPALEQAGVVTHSEIAKGLSQLVANMNVQFGPVEDVTYSIPTHDSIVAILKWAAIQRDTILPKRNGMVFVSEKADCDNFARWAVFGADLGAMQGELDGQVLVSRFNVDQVVMFGGVPAGGRHALNWFASDKGVFVFEPQSYPEKGSIAQVAKWKSGVGSELIRVYDYPNFNYVYFIKFD